MITRIVKSSKAALDLTSIMVGVIVIGLIGGVIAATVFAVIPWVQDNAAKQQLDEVKTAQDAYVGLSAPSAGAVLSLVTVSKVNVQAVPAPNYGTLKQLVDAGYLNIKVSPTNDSLSADGNLCIVVDANNSFRSEIKSPTGALFVTTDKTNTSSLIAKDSKCFQQEPAAPAAKFTYLDGGYWTEGAGDNGKNAPVLFVESLEVKTDSTVPVDWEIKLDRSKAPYNAIPIGDVKVLTGLPEWASVKSDANFITIYNNTATAKITASSSSKIGQLRFEFTPPTYKADEMNNGGPINIAAAGTNKVQAGVQVSLKNSGEGRYGFWETDIDVAAMKNQLGQNGTAAIAPAWAAQGFSLTQKSGTVYTLKYAPTNEQAFMLKGKDASHQNLGTPTPTLNTIIIFTGDGKVSATVTLGNLSGDQYSGIQQVNIVAKSSGSWGPVEINLKDLLDKGKRLKGVAVNNGSFTLVKNTDDASGNTYFLSFTGNYQSPSSVDIQLR